MTVLVATPYRHDTLQAFLHRHREVVGSFTYPDLEHVMMENDLGHVQGGKYAPNAEARNQLIEQHLRPDHQHVLWMDVDVVKAPKNLVEGLLALAGTVDAAAPWALIEGRDQFYDYGGFVLQNGAHFRPNPPYTDAKGPVYPMDSVGTCYLVPARYYWKGCRYDPEGDEVEHLSFFRQVRDLGGRVWSTDQLIVRHAHLPKWGEAWH